LLSVRRSTAKLLSTKLTGTDSVVLTGTNSVVLTVKASEASLTVTETTTGSWVLLAKTTTGSWVPETSAASSEVISKSTAEMLLWVTAIWSSDDSSWASGTDENTVSDAVSGRKAYWT
jgi:hypothetical protein